YRPARRNQSGSERRRDVDRGQRRQSHLLRPRSHHSEPLPVWQHGRDRPGRQGRRRGGAVAAPDRGGTGYWDGCPQSVSAGPWVFWFGNGKKKMEAPPPGGPPETASQPAPVFAKPGGGATLWAATSPPPFYSPPPAP